MAATSSPETVTIQLKQDVDAAANKATGALARMEAQIGREQGALARLEASLVSAKAKMAGIASGGANGARP